MLQFTQQNIKVSKMATTAEQDLARLNNTSVNRKHPMATAIKDLYKKYKGFDEKDLAIYDYTSFTIQELRCRFYNLMSTIEKAL